MKKIGIIMVMIVILISLCTSITFAESSFNLTVTADKTTLKASDIVTLEFKVSDINMGENGINALEGFLVYDTNIFETVKNSDFQGLNNWSATYNDTTSSLSGKFVLARLSAGIKEEQSILKISLKVKPDVTSTDTVITIKDIFSNDGNELVPVSDKKITFKIEGNTNSTENNNQTDTNGSNNTVGGNNIVSDNTVSEKPMPATGKTTSFAILFVGLALIAFLVYKNIRLKNN